jgi:hypothetical protein
MDILFGVVFLLFGLALAVLLGIVLYRDPQKEIQPHVSLANGKDPEAA